MFMGCVDKAVANLQIPHSHIKLLSDDLIRMLEYTANNSFNVDSGVFSDMRTYSKSLYRVKKHIKGNEQFIEPQKIALSNGGCLAYVSLKKQLDRLFERDDIKKDLLKQRNNETRTTGNTLINGSKYSDVNDYLNIELSTDDFQMFCDSETKRDWHVRDN